MFLRKMIKRNPQFIKTVVQLHQNGEIPANSYVLDLDTVEKNAGIISAEGKRLGLKVFPMTKQIGRNPVAFHALAKEGLESYVAVDMGCAWSINAAGYKIGHIGHLVQIPSAETDAAASFKPDYWTVFNMEKAQAASDASGKIGREQKLLARIHAPGDIFYMGHEGGFEAKDITAVADMLDTLPNALFAGITTFPALLYNPDSREVEPTPNLGTLEKAAAILQAAGREDIEINAPGTTSKVVMPMLASAGSTQVEPGHGLTGSTPLHAVRDLPESPAVLYVTEVSHFYQGKAFCFGGGLYIDPVFPDYVVKCLVGKDPDTVTDRPMPVEFPPANAIDYYGLITPDPRYTVEVGDTVVFGFRIQAFVTRAFVVPLNGVSSGKPVIGGVYTPDGRKTNWPDW
jgi:predicted amino acid racemase